MTRRRWWLVLIAGVALATLVAAGLGALPALVRRAAVTAIATATGRAAAMDAFEFDVFTGRLTVRGLRLTDRDGVTTVAGFERLEARIHRRSLLTGRLWIEDVRIVNPVAHVIRLGPDEFNVSDLLHHGSRHAHRLDVTIDRFSLVGGTLTLEDRVLKPERTWTARSFVIEARHVAARRGGGRASAAGFVAGAAVAVTVEDLRLVPWELRGTVTLKDVDLALSRFYIHPASGLVLERGRLDAALSLARTARAGLRVDGEVRVRDVAMARAGGREPFLVAPALTLGLTRLVVAERSLALGRLELAGAGAVLDTRVTPAARFELTRVRAVAEGVTWPVSAPARLALDSAIPGGGDLAVRGTVRARPAAADVDLRLTGVNLAPWARYLSPAARVEGVADATLALSAALDATLTPRARGRIAVRDLQVADGARPLLGAEAVDVVGLDAQWPARLDVARLRVRRPSTTIERDERGEVALRALLARALTPRAPAGAPAIVPAISVGELLVEDGAVAWRDAAVTPPVRADFTAVDVAVRGAAWPARGPARVRFGARVAGGGELTIEGAARLDVISGDARIIARGVDAALARPYLPLAARVEGTADADLAVTVGRERGLTASVRGTVGVSDLVVTDGARPVVRAERAEIGGLAAEWPSRIAVARLHLRRPWALVERTAPGEFPLRALLSLRPPVDADARAPAPKRPDVVLGELALEDGTIAWRDAAARVPVSVDLTRVQLDVLDAGWPARVPARVRMSARLPEGGEIAVQGTARLDVLDADVRVTVARVPLGLAEPYLAVPARVRGAVDADVTARVRGAGHSTVRGKLAIAGLAVIESGAPVFSADRIALADLAVWWPSRVAVARVELHRPAAVVERQSRGLLRALLALRPRQLDVAELVVSDGRATWHDASTTPATRFDVGDLGIVVRDAAWPARRPAQVQVDLRPPGGGELHAKGTARFDVPRGDVRVTLKGVDLAPYRSYLPIAASVGGRLDADLDVAADAGRALRATVQGRAGVSRLVLATPERTLLTVEHADVAGIAAQWPERVAIARVRLHRPWGLVERDARGNFPLLAHATAVPPAAPTPRARPSAIALEIGELVVEEGGGRFVDHTLTPAYAEDFSRFGLVANGLTTTPGRRGRLTAQATLGPAARLDLRGEIGPLRGPMFLDLTGTVQDVAIPRVNPYLRRLLAWIANAGSLSTTVRYRVENGRLDATHDVVVGRLDAVRAGDADQAQYRIGLPLGLIIAMLKDSRGEIRLTLPVTGYLADRRFDFHEAMWSVARNLAIQAIALPVSWIGRLAFSEDSKIERITIHPVTFRLGEAAPTPEGEAHLERVAAFLRGSPAVHLTLRPVLTVTDVDALRRERVRAAIDRLARERGLAAPAAAAALFAARFPGRDVPGDAAALIAALVADEPMPDAALEALAARRIGAIRERLGAKGITAARLATGGAPPSVAGVDAGRVEFDIGDDHRVAD